jgi:hypothetical protein
MATHHNPDTHPAPFDPMCGRTPAEIGYVFYRTDENGAPLLKWDGTPYYNDDADYVWQEEGTLNTSNGHFLCDECYIKAGQPSSPSGWVCP